MIELQPLVLDGRVVPRVFVDGVGREPHFVAEMANGRIVYSHESGYGYLNADQVRILEPK